MIFVLLCLVCLAISFYTYIGYFLANASLKVWNQRDSTSWPARVLFPFSAYNGTVGYCDCESSTCFDDGPSERLWYLWLAGIFWPIKVCWTIPGNLLFTLPKFIAFVWQKIARSRTKVKTPELDVLSSEAGDDLPRLYQKLRAIDDASIQLKADRATVVVAINEWKRRIESVCEAEEITSGES